MRSARHLRSSSLLCVIGVLASMSWGCLEDNKAPEGLRSAALSGGPRIVFNLDTRPFPEIPFPNDLATRVDTTSPTGLRVNISTMGASDVEEKVRRELNSQTGFAVNSTMSVRFDQAINVRDLARRHQELTPDFSDDAVYLVDVDPQSPEFGELKLLDMGRGNYPLTLSRPNAYFNNDPRSQGTNLLMETVQEEDLNGNGVLDPIEDTDDDGVWDRPNTMDPGADPLAFGQLLDFYERETNTLLLRPVQTLRPATRYAVVLTSALVGEDGAPIESPFDTINHRRQTKHLDALRQILPKKLPKRFDKSLKQVRFAWTFTTGTPTDTLEAVRAGLYGHGPLSWLNEQYKPELNFVHNATSPTSALPMVFNVGSVINTLAPLLTQAVGGAGSNALRDSYDYVDYVVSGTFISPYFLKDKDGLADEIPGQVEQGDAAALLGRNAQDDDESFKIDLVTGEASVRPGEVTFSCVVPKATEKVKPPFKTIIYSHAIGSTRFEILAFGGMVAKFGFASCAIDAVGHGLAIPAEYESLLDRVSLSLKMPNLATVLTHDRGRDINNDGVKDIAGDYFTSDLLHARDMLRQTTIDQLQFIRILRHFDGKRRFPDAINGDDPYVRARGAAVAPWDANGDGQSELAGDFNGDGVVDFGTDTTYAAWGTSLGGIQAAVLSGIEPTIRVMSSNAGGGGLGDIAARTEISNVRIGVVLRMMGPTLIGTPLSDGTTSLAWMLPDALDAVAIPFARVEGLEDGDRIILRNLRRERNPLVESEDRWGSALVRKGRFRVAVAADAISATARRAKMGFTPVASIPRDVLGCVRTGCGEMACEETSYCDTSINMCRPLGQCLAKTEIDALNDEQRAYVAQDPVAFGDPLLIQIYDKDNQLKQEISTFEQSTIYQGIIYPKGAPLAALQEGWGLKRQTPKLRRFLGIGQWLLEPADPSIWAHHYLRQPLLYPYESPDYRVGHTNALIVGTLGDQTVPINTGLSLARNVGVIGLDYEDARFGMSPNQQLVQSYTYEGIPGLDRYPEYPRSIYDPDDLDNHTFSTPWINQEPESALRATIVTREFGARSALRLPFLDPLGAHTFNLPNPTLAFDMHTFMLNQTGLYLGTGGRVLSDDPCLETDVHMSTCAFFDQPTFEPWLPTGPLPPR